MDEKQSTCTALAVRDQYTALHIAAAHGWLDVVRILVEKFGFVPDYRDSKGRTPLHFACYYGQTGVVKYLQFYTPVSGQENYLPLHYALDAPMYDPSLDSQPAQYFVYTEVVKFLVLKCPFQLSHHCRTQNLSHKILCMACKYYMALARHYSVLQHTEYISPVYTIQACSQEPTPVACTCGKLDILNYLIKEGFCSRGYCETGKSMLLRIACMIGRLDIVKYLVEERHIDPEVCDGEGNTPLHLACMIDNLEIAKYFIVNRRCSPSVHNTKSQLPLHLACRNQSFEMVKLVSNVTLSSAINGEDSDGYTPLHYACGYDMYEYWFKTPRAHTSLSLSVVLFLVENCACDPMKPIKFYGGAQSSLIEVACKQSNLGLLHALTSVTVNCQDENGNSPLHMACKHNEIKIVSYLTNERNCNQTVPNSIGEIPLHIACQKKSLEMVKFVSNCDINAQADYGDTPLHIACRHKALEIVRYLVQARGCSPPHHPDLYSNLRIHVACDADDLLLVQSIATPENVNHYYDKHDRTTPLHIACKQGNVELATFLVMKMHADPNVVFDWNRELPLHIACRLNSLKMVRLVSGCKQINYKDFSYGNTPLHTACKDGTLETVKYLVEEKQCLTVIQNNQGELPLHIACERQSLEMVKLVSNCDLNQRKNGRLHCCCHYMGNFQYSDLGDTPLHMAFRLGAIDIVRYLIKTGKCDLTIDNDEGELSIHCACKRSLDLVKLTIKYCIQNPVNATTVNGATPLHLACVYEKLDIVRFLIEEKGANCRAYDRHGLTPLHYAYGFCASYNCATLSHDEAAVAKYLVTKCDCDPAEEINRDNNVVNLFPYIVNDDYLIVNDDYLTADSPLEKALAERNFEHVKVFLSGSLNVNWLNSRGECVLHTACKYEHPEVVEFLVKGKYCNQSLQNRAGELALHIACKQNCLDIVRLVSDFDVNMKTAAGETPLHIACRHCHAEIVEYLISKNSCDPTILNDDGYLPLHVACEQNSLALVKLVSKCNVNTKTKDGDTPLHIVLKQTSTVKTSQKFQILKYLVQEKLCDITLPDSSNDIPIHIACKQCELVFVKLLTNDESVKYKDKIGNTPLHIACWYGRRQIVNFLVGVNASIVNVQNKDGNTPLHLALLQQATSSLEQIQCLVGDNTQCDISISNSLGELPLHIACGSEWRSLTLIRLLSQGNPIIVNSRTQLGDTPLHIACRMKSPAIVMYLLDNLFCNVNIQNSKGELPLHILCRERRLGLIQYSLKNTDSDANIQNHKGELPLHLACHHSLDIVKEIGIHTRCCDVKSVTGDTPLHVACRYRCYDIAKYLVTMRCDHSVQNNKGLLPLHIASCHGSLTLVKSVSNCNPNLQAIASDEVSCQTYPVVIKIKSGDTPLHIACRTENFEVVEFLIRQKDSNASIPNDFGELPLHTACYNTAPDSLEIVKLVSRCNPNAQTKHGDTPLHIAVSYSQTAVVQYLVQQKQCDTNIPNEEGEIPLHIVCEGYNIEKLELFSSISNINARTKRGDTPLHIACSINDSRAKYTVEYLTTIKGCDLTAINNDADMPLHIICRNEHFDLDIVKLVCANNLNARNLSGNTPLHEAFARKFNARKLLDYLVAHSDVSICNNLNELPLHLACRTGPGYFAQYCRGVNSQTLFGYVSGVYVNSQTRLGNSPLHEACICSDLDIAIKIVKYLIKVLECDPNVQNSDCELPLHLACRRKSLKMVKLVSGCNPILKTRKGNSPLHEACILTSDSDYHKSLREQQKIRKTFIPLLKYLIEELGCVPQCQNNVGRTPLHYLCESNISTQAIEYLLSNSKVKPSIVDNEGQTPMMLATNLEVTKLLLKHGADATSLYEMHRNFFKMTTPPPTPLNVLVVGNASMGKTTLIESLKNEAHGAIMAEPQTHTAGIIPNDFHSEVYGSVILYDFAGQQEYYASHEAVVHKIIRSTPPVIILLTNITESKSDIKKNILYWISFIENRCTTLREKPHLIIVGSHADCLKHSGCGESTEDKMSHIITSLQPRFLKSPMRFVASVGMDCRQSQSPGITTLRALLKQSSKKLQDTAVMNFTCHCLCVFLQDKLNHFAALPVEHIVNAILTSTSNTKPPTAEHAETSAEQHSTDPLMQEPYIPEALLPTDVMEINHICEELNDRGILIFLKNRLKPHMSWVILNKENLLSIINGTVFAPHNFKQYRNLSSSTGVVPFQRIATHFPGHDPTMIVEFLSYMEFCQEIQDQEVLDLLKPFDKASGTSSLSERYFFFPRLVSVETPQGIWESDTDHGYQWGWMLHCTETDHFFTPHFFQVLMLRLAFSFALIPSKLPSDDDMPALKRICSVWKRGIYWASNRGVEATVELIEQSQAVIVMVRNYKGFVSELECVQHRSSIMRKVLQAKKTFCPNVSTAESFIHPKCLHYPLACIREMILFSFPIVTQAVIDSEPFAVSDDGKMFNVEKLILFEPYSHISENNLQTIFDPENQKKKVEDKVLKSIAHSITEHTEDPKALEFKCKMFLEVFKVMHHSHNELLEIFQAWKSHSAGTYQCLREKLDDFSLFCGRNPLEFYTTSGKVIIDSHGTHLNDDPPSLSNEHKGMLRCFPKIIKYLADQQCARSLAAELLRSELISNHVYDLATNAGPGVVESTRIEPMVKAVLSKVQLNPQIYYKFIDILTEMGGLKEIVHLLQESVLQDRCLQ